VIICVSLCWFVLAQGCGCFISLTAVPLRGPARARAFARRPFGLASAVPRLAGAIRKNSSVLRRLPRAARLAIEARPKGRPRGGPRRSRGTAVSENKPAMRQNASVPRRLSRTARLAIEARPKGRPRGGPRRSRGTAMSENKPGNTAKCFRISPANRGTAEARPNGRRAFMARPRGGPRRSRGIAVSDIKPCSCQHAPSLAAFPRPQAAKR
jgi:hypothetical protein